MKDHKMGRVDYCPHCQALTLRINLICRRCGFIYEAGYLSKQPEVALIINQIRGKLITTDKALEMLYNRHITGEVAKQIMAMPIITNFDMVTSVLTEQGIPHATLSNGHLVAITETFTFMAMKRLLEAGMKKISISVRKSPGFIIEF